MPKMTINMGGTEVEVEYDDAPGIPEEWVDLIGRLHPITACVVWEILTNHLSPATLTLAQSSPDWNRFTALRIVGGGNPNSLDTVCELARDELEEIYATLIPNDPRRILH